MKIKNLIYLILPLKNQSKITLKLKPHRKRKLRNEKFYYFYYIYKIIHNNYH